MATVGTAERSHAGAGHMLNRAAPVGGPTNPGRVAPALVPMGRGRLDLFRADDRRSAAQRAQRLALQTASLARLPRPVASFWLRALRTARTEHDTWSIDVACRPAELRVLLDALDGAAADRRDRHRGGAGRPAA